MNDASLQVGNHVVVQREHLQALLDALDAHGYQVIGPTLRDSAIVYDEIDEVEDLPVGWTDEQDGGTYRLHRRDDEAVFGYAVGPQSWKQYLHLPTRRLWQAQRSSDGSDMVFVEETPETPRRAFLGVRSCELNAIAIQHRVFAEGPFLDPLYKALHDNTFIVAVNCSHAGGTCFCSSMNTGPQARRGYDLSLTELLTSEQHVFLCHIGSPAGAEMMHNVPFTAAEATDKAAAQRVVEETANSMGRHMDVTDIKDLLYQNFEHPRWEEVANRCLTCSNCTIVCPTCFCTTTEDNTNLTGDVSERWQRWDSCFTTDFSYIHGGSVRSSGKARYRQWMTHKLASWLDQFGTSGCVGCGRCITWCPVGIDITEEVAAIRADKNKSIRPDISTLNMV
jgi:formate hydrogenlyase subunit 6/NADH:ubiquinone oxidoreductase subunit I